MKIKNFNSIRINWFLVINIFFTIFIIFTSIFLIRTFYSNILECSDTYCIYENMTESILDGRIDLGSPSDDFFSNLDNPYDPNLRNERGVSFKWDHALYKGNYYMYFGIVPIFTFFLPAYFITGTIPPTYSGVLFFIFVFVLGFFLFFNLINKYFIKSLHNWIKSLLYVTVCIAIIYCNIKFPFTYNLAIISGLSSAVWSFNLCLLSIYWCKNKFSQKLIFIVSLVFAALIFGCKPTIGIFSIGLIPFIVTFIKKQKNYLFFVLSVIPALLILTLLATYNYLRFDNIFEFGQSYQLTSYDQHDFNILKTRLDIKYLLISFLKYFIKPIQMNDTNNGIMAGGIFVNAPIYLILFTVCLPKVIKRCKKNKTLKTTLLFMSIAIIVVFLDVSQSPYWCERYLFELYFILFFPLCILLSTFYDEIKKHRMLFHAVFIILALFTIVNSVALLFSYDYVNNALFNFLYC